MKNEQAKPGMRAEIESENESARAQNQRAKSARVLAAALALCGPILAQNALEARVARPLSEVQDIKTVAAPTLKTGGVSVAAPTLETSVASAAEQSLETASARSESGRLPSARSHSARIDHSKVIYGTATEGSVRARGATYKSEFTPASATYVPFLGSRAEKNHPVSFVVESVRAGGEELPIARGVGAVRAGESVRFERGAMTEVYDLSASSIEQKFVFANPLSTERPAVSSACDLEILIRVESDMTRSIDAQGLVLGNELGGIRYGRAEVVDASGHRAPASTEWIGERIQIGVAGSFLTQATFPVTIDPLISTFTIDNSSDDDFLPDLAFDGTTGNFVTVYEETFSATDHDVVAVISEADGLAIPGGLYYIDDTPEDWTKPRVASNHVASQFLIVAEVGIGGVHTIRGRTLPAAGVGMGVGIGPKITISAQDQNEVMNPDVGGDASSSSPSYYCVVWERAYSVSDHDVHACLVSSDGTVSPIIYVDNSANTLDTHPSISKCDGLPPFVSEEWTVVWERFYAVGDHDVFGAQIHWDGGITTAPFAMMTSPSDETAPRVSSILDGDGSPRPYMVVCSLDAPLIGQDILGALFTGDVHMDSKNLSLLDSGANFAKNQLQPAIDSDGHQFVVTYTEQYANGSSDYDPYVTTFNSAGGVIGLSEPRVQLSNASATEYQLAIAAVHSGGDGLQASNGFMIAWCSDTAAHGNDIAGALYSSSAGGPKTTFCFGTDVACPCGNSGAPGNGCAHSQSAGGAHLDASGVAQVSADTLVLQGSSMPSPSTCLYFQGSGTNPHAIGDGLICAGGGLVRLGTKANVNGSSTFGDGNDPHVSVKGNVPAAGGTRYYQIWYRDNHSFCMAETYNFTNGVSVVWVP